MLLPEIRAYIEKAILLFDAVPDERKKILQKISSYIEQKQREGRPAELIYVCTHNSRRSHLGQLWGNTAALFYEIENVNTYSAGTEATALHPNAIMAMQRAGFEISKTLEGENPTYHVIFDNQNPSLVCFSKTWLDSSIPTTGLCAIMTCTEADGNCPFIPGTELRISCPYQDPKAFDGTPEQDNKYNERCLQIAVENLYLFSIVKK